MNENTQTPFRNTDYEHPAGHSLDILPCPRTWFVESVLVTMFCCFPLGLPALWFSSRVERRHALGYYDEAQTASRRARILVRWAIILGALFWVVTLCLYLSGAIDVGQLLTYSI